MKTLVLSDIHANIIALEAVWEKEKDCDRIICCGDLVDYGPYPREVLAWVCAHDVTCVQGNHDRWVPKAYREGRTLETVPVEERGWENLNASLLTEEEIRFLEALPIARVVELDGVHYGMTHMYIEYKEIVSLYGFRQFTTELFNGAAPAPVKRMLMGHTHRQSIRYLADDTFWMNPGSVSYRRRDDPDQAAHYATITDGRISLKRADYDVSRLRKVLQTVKLRDSEMEVASYYWGSRD